MRLIDVAEWLVLQKVCLHLTAAIGQLSLSELSSNLRYTLQFLEYELRIFAAIVDTQQDLDYNIISRFLNEVIPVLTTLEKLLGVHMKDLLEEAGKVIEGGFYQDWKHDSEGFPEASLVDERQCTAAVSALESFNDSMQACFRARVRNSIPNMDKTDANNTKVDFGDDQALSTLLNAIQEKLDCRGSCGHQLFLQLAGQQWQECRDSPKSFHVSSDETQNAFQAIEVFDSAFITSSATEKQEAGQELSNLCGEIKSSLDFNIVLKLRRLDHVLYKMVSTRYTRQKPESPVVSIKSLIEEKVFSPVSFDCVNESSLTVSEKRKLTLDLSRCLLRLLDCEWTNHCWNIDEIFFLSSPSKVPTRYLRNIPPYIACKAVDCSTAINGGGDLLGNSVFLQFGKLLVEIETGYQVIPTEEDRHGRPSMWFTIDKILTDGRMSSACDKYSEAVEACLHLHLTSGNLANLTMKERQQKVYDQLVVKLEKDFGHYGSFSLKRKRRGSGDEGFEPPKKTKRAPFSSNHNDISNDRSRKPFNLERAITPVPFAATMAIQSDTTPEAASQSGSTGSNNPIRDANNERQLPCSTTNQDVQKDYVHYKVAIVCAIEFEMSAVRYMLDHEHPELRTKSGDPNIYVLGDLSGHDVVLSCLPGTQGKGAAATVATHIERTFPSIQWWLFVGIAGGVPTRHDIRLGDVVISMPEGNHNGVVQYDLGKETTDGFITKGFLESSPPLLRNAVLKMKSDHLASEKKIETFISAMRQKGPRLSNTYQQPPSNSDVLFEPGYTHDTRNDTCAKCDRQKTIDRTRRHSQGPEIHYGLVASGDCVMKSAAKRDEIVRNIGDILCFEMEAAGLMTGNHGLIIRGISDYADSHKNDGWQYYAAATAAACTKELLTRLNPI